MSAPRVRRSLDVVYYEWKNPQKPGDGNEFECLIKSMRAIQQRDPDNKWSFFTIGGYHGQPFRGKGETDGDYWGGYCNHGNVLFPTWHRAYLWDLENAMRSVEGCETVTLPFWDECANIATDPTLPIVPSFVPECLTLPEIQLREDTEPKPNPIYSYRLQKAITDQIQGANQRYSKPLHYETVRYPLSGLVGNEQDKVETQIYNANFKDPDDRRTILNGNVGSWLVTGVTIPPDDNQPNPTPGPSDTSSAHARFLKCLNAPDYTVFSNTSSQAEWNANNKEDQVMSLESPHNSIHLAVGGFYQKGVYNANPGVEERGANGDMGANEMAGFDPIFFFHHCFIDYVFWQWQKRRGLTQRGQLTVDYSIKSGTTIQEGAAGYPLGDNDVGQPITMDTTKLYPFTGSSGEVLTSDDVTNIEELGYTYGIGSLDAQLERGPGKPSWLPLIGEPDREVALKKRVSGINRADYPGSFVIRIYSRLPSGEEVEVERDPILSRWNVTNCRNCRDKLEVTSVFAIDKPLLDRLQGGDPEKKPDFTVAIQLIGRVLRKPYPFERGTRPWAPGNLVGGPGPAPPEPIIEDLF